MLRRGTRPISLDMQIAVKRAPFLQIGARKRRLMRFAVEKVMGDPAPWKQTSNNARWLLFSDPSLDWEDVRRLIAVVKGIAQFPDEEPDADWDKARKKVRDWAKNRLPDWPADEFTDLNAHFGRPWLRFNTEGMVPVDDS